MAAELGRGAVRFGLEMRTRMHGHAELGEQERQRQQLDDQAAITSNQKASGRAAVSAQAPAADNLRQRKGSRKANKFTDAVPFFQDKGTAISVVGGSPNENPG